MDNFDSILNDAYYEAVASQEEFYLEETEEEVRAILVADEPVSPERPDKPPDQAAEELITGDGDEPPLSDEAIGEMLNTTDSVSSDVLSFRR